MLRIPQHMDLVVSNVYIQLFESAWKITLFPRYVPTSFSFFNSPCCEYRFSFCRKNPKYIKNNRVVYTSGYVKTNKWFNLIRKLNTLKKLSGYNCHSIYINLPELMVNLLHPLSKLYFVACLYIISANLKYFYLRVRLLHFYSKKKTFAWKRVIFSKSIILDVRSF